jgi:hypothetical protein
MQEPTGIGNYEHESEGRKVEIGLPVQWPETTSSRPSENINTVLGQEIP